MSQQRTAAVPLAGSGGDLEKYLTQPVPESDYVLLCAFGLGCDDERSGRYLRQALIRAGFLPRSTRHLVASSPLLRRTGSRTFRLRGPDER